MPKFLAFLDRLNVATGKKTKVTKGTAKLDGGIGTFTNVVQVTPLGNDEVLLVRWKLKGGSVTAGTTVSRFASLRVIKS